MVNQYNEGQYKKRADWINNWLKFKIFFEDPDYICRCCSSKLINSNSTLGLLILIIFLTVIGCLYFMPASYEYGIIITMNAIIVNLIFWNYIWWKYFVKLKIKSES